SARSTLPRRWRDRRRRSASLPRPASWNRRAACRPASRDAEGGAKGTLAHVPETQTLHIDLQAREPEGGLIARLAKMDGLPAIEAGMRGRGPLDTWNGTINLTAGATAAISGAASIRREGKGHRVALGVNADVQHLLPANVAPLFEGVSK